MKIRRIKCYICKKEISVTRWRTHYKAKHSDIDEVKYRDKLLGIIPRKCRNPNCNKDTTYYKGNYKLYCCFKCSSSCPLINEKIKLAHSTGKPLEKSKQTCSDRYGVEFPMQSKEIQDKSKQTSLKNCGYEYPAQCPKAKEKYKQTCLAEYGVENLFQLEEVKEKSKQTRLYRYGVEYVTRSREIQDKSKQTCLVEYGVEYTLQIPHVREKTYLPETAKKRHETQKKNGTYEIAARKRHETKKRDGIYKIAIKKCHETMKKNGTYGKSKKEDAFHEFFKFNFDENVERQARYDQWSIDFYSPKYNMYIQFDGDYWHGYLNTPEELQKSKQGRVILGTIERDKLQNQTIPNLIRIKESEFDKGILEIL